MSYLALGVGKQGPLGLRMQGFDVELFGGLKKTCGV